MLEGTRSAETPREEALAHLLHGGPYAGTPDALVAVENALASFDVPTVRALFDQCLVGRATAEDLADAFRVSRDESAAYAELFFDLSVFHNDLHLIAWIAAQDEGTGLRAAFTEAHTHGFRHLRAKYAAERDGVTPVQGLERVLEADVRTYLRDSHISLGDPRSKALRDLHKSVLTTAATLAKVSTPGKGIDPEAHAGAASEFEVQHRPANPTLDELAARGIHIVT